MSNNRFYQKTDTERKSQARARAGDGSLHTFVDGENVNSTPVNTSNTYYDLQQQQHASTIDLLSPSQNDIYDEQQNDSSDDDTHDDDLQELSNVLDVNREKKFVFIM
ncbi:unnamed protein product [Didymodactylos carnosus]|uniref:Uncharacterized protein n=1 Tax=Didymodactylos carnosus TaxID=1234261 RepID=A0A814VMU4_9BILA|nr:unnamed protein product [Didymodactylos carnosus]CAF3954274.1 unnamed protein product [Didymodactylos carnosus]